MRTPDGRTPGWERMPSDAGAEGGGPADSRPAGDHLRIDLDSCADERLRECADVLYGTGRLELAGELLRRYPGCLLVTLRDAERGLIAVSRTGARAAVPTGSAAGSAVGHAAGAAGALSADEHASIASLLHRRLVATRSLEPLSGAVLTDSSRSRDVRDHRSAGRPTGSRLKGAGPVTGSRSAGRRPH